MDHLATLCSYYKSNQLLVLLHYCIKYNQQARHTIFRGSGGMPSRRILKVRCAEIESEGISKVTTFHIHDPSLPKSKLCSWQTLRLQLVSSKISSSCAQPGGCTIAFQQNSSIRLLSLVFLIILSFFAFLFAIPD